MKKYQTMICLVGEGPLPIYFGIQQFTDPGATIVLVHSTGSEHTAKIAEAIKNVCCDPSNTSSKPDREYVLQPN